METKIIAVSVDELTHLLSTVVKSEFQSLIENQMIGGSFKDELWDRKTTAEFLGISEQTLTKQFREGRITGQKSGRKYHFLKSSILKFLRSN